jgi:hypothetical protein
MKIALAIILVVLAVLACGCTSTAPQAVTTVPTPAPIVIPDLMGTWTGQMLGYEERTGFTDYGNMPITMVVTEQHGRLFSGYFTFGVNSTKPLEMAGVISHDGRTFAMVENANGYTTGELTGTDTMELTHIDDADPYSAALDTLKRV